MASKSRAEKIALETIEKYGLVDSGDLVVVGLSGGPDSLCLFNILLENREALGVELIAVHVNHGIRGNDALEDQKFVEDFCEKAKLPCRVFSYDCPAFAKENGLSSEEAGRVLRYQAFEEVAKTFIEEFAAGKVKIAVAHNANDNVETVLFRILRGTSTAGLAGMEYLHATGSNGTGASIIRPLLDVKREEIESYCVEKGLEPRRDKTNDEAIYERNKIRLELLPFLRKAHNPNIDDGILRMTQAVRDDANYLDECAARYAGKSEYSTEELLEMPAPIRRRVILKAFAAAGLSEDISFAHLRAAEELLKHEDGSASVDFPKGFRFVVAYGVAKAVGPSSGHAEEFGLRTSLISAEEYRHNKLTQYANAACFDADLVGDFAGLIGVKTREAGDYIELKVGRKLIQDLFVNMKIPKDERDFVKLCAIGNKVLWIPEQTLGGNVKVKARYAEKYSISGATERVLVLEKA